MSSDWQGVRGESANEPSQVEIWSFEGGHGEGARCTWDRLRCGAVRPADPSVGGNWTACWGRWCDGKLELGSVELWVSGGCQADGGAEDRDGGRGEETRRMQQQAAERLELVLFGKPPALAAT